MGPVSARRCLSDTPEAADPRGIGTRIPSSDLRRAVAAATACAALGLLSYGRAARVPLLGWIDLAVHEFGHVVTYPLPDLATAMAGSIAQVALPLAVAAHFLHRREPLSAMLCLAWAGTSARDVSVYVADAPYERLQLIGGIHDWAFALGPEGLDALGRAGAIASAVSGAGLLMVVAAVAGSLATPVVRARPAAPPRTEAPVPE
jgi:hypothetical protein